MGLFEENKDFSINLWICVCNRSLHNSHGTACREHQFWVWTSIATNWNLESSFL